MNPPRNSRKPHFFMLYGFWRLTGSRQYSKDFEKAVNACRRMNAKIVAKKHNLI